MIVDVTNELLTKLKLELKPITVLTSYPIDSPKFPCVIVEEIDNSAYSPTKDSSGFNHSDISIEINIFTVGDTKMSKSKSIRSSVDSIMSDNYGLNRTFGRSVPNYLDESVYRYRLIYRGIIDENKKIYGR